MLTVEHSNLPSLCFSSKGMSSITVFLLLMMFISLIGFSANVFLRYRCVPHSDQSREAQRIRNECFCSVQEGWQRWVQLRRGEQWWIVKGGPDPR